MTLITDRLLLRPWSADDLAPFARINADPRVTQYLGATLSRAQSDALATRIGDDFRRHGFGLWAAERSDAQACSFIGFIGLSVPRFDAPFTPCVEIGWRLAPEHWGDGLATEGATAVVAHAFGALRLQELVSFTAVNNAASRRVMEKIGMRRDPAEDFDHPALPREHQLSRHVLYRIRAPKEIARHSG